VCNSRVFIYSGVIGMMRQDAAANKSDAKCKCAMRNVIFVSELIGFGDRKATMPQD